jgi:uncharacterized protein (DUF2147 family)
MRPHLAALIVTALSCLCLGARPVDAQEPSAVGLWQQVDDAGKVSGWFLISEHAGVYEGAIAKMFMKPGEDQNPHCDKCEGDQKGVPWLGLTIIKKMDRKGLDYANGSILDPRNGNEWHAEMHLSPDGQDITVRGYLGIPTFGMNQYWKRLPDCAFAQLDPALAAKFLPPANPAKPNPAQPKSRTADAHSPGCVTAPAPPAGH